MNYVFVKDLPSALWLVGLQQTSQRDNFCGERLVFEQLLFNSLLRSFIKETLVFFVDE